MMYSPEQDGSRDRSLDTESKETTSSGIASISHKPFLVARKWRRLPDLKSTKWPRILTRWLPSSLPSSNPKNELASEGCSE